MHGSIGNYSSMFDKRSGEEGCKIPFCVHEEISVSEEGRLFSILS